jgi:hypothetical protein
MYQGDKKKGEKRLPENCENWTCPASATEFKQQIASFANFSSI